MATEVKPLFTLKLYQLRREHRKGAVHGSITSQHKCTKIQIWGEMFPLALMYHLNKSRLLRVGDLNDTRGSAASQQEGLGFKSSADCLHATT